MCIKRSRSGRGLVRFPHVCVSVLKLVMAVLLRESKLFLSRGKPKSDNSLKRLRIELRSEMTIEKTTRH